MTVLSAAIGSKRSSQYFMQVVALNISRKKRPGAGKADSWIHTWHAASDLPGTAVISDLGGREVDLFRAAISGETVVYDAAGDLRFHGGITGARGHAGDNAGCSAVESYANTGAAPLAQTSVFGCPIFNPTSQTP